MLRTATAVSLPFGMIGRSSWDLRFIPTAFPFRPTYRPTDTYEPDVVGSQGTPSDRYFSQPPRKPHTFRTLSDLARLVSSGSDLRDRRACSARPARRDRRRPQPDP